MPTLRSLIPPIRSLLAFEAAARHLNFTRAGRELNVTQAAISRQIRTLESDLDVKLFDRVGRKVRLNNEGRWLSNVISANLGSIATACMQLRLHRKENLVSVYASLSFCTCFLTRRLPTFCLREPTVDYRLLAFDPYMARDIDEADISIRYGNGNWPGWNAQSLFPDAIIPVCSSAYLRGRAQLRRPQDFLTKNLLHSDIDDPNWISWKAWLKLIGVELNEQLRGPKFSNNTALLEAARAGQGIALASASLVDHLLESGELVQPWPITLSTNNSFHLLMPAEAMANNAAIAFCSWLLEEAAIFRTKLSRKLKKAKIIPWPGRPRLPT